MDEDVVLSVSALGEALIALEDEDLALAEEMERSAARMRHYVVKRKIIHATIRKLLDNAGMTYARREWPKFPELNG